MIKTDSETAAHYLIKLETDLRKQYDVDQGCPSTKQEGVILHDIADLKAWLPDSALAKLNPAIEDILDVVFDSESLSDGAINGQQQDLSAAERALNRI